MYLNIINIKKMAAVTTLFSIFLRTLIYNLIDAVAIGVALIVLVRVFTHFVPIVDWEHFKKNSTASTIILIFVILTFITFSVVGVITDPSI